MYSKTLLTFAGILFSGVLFQATANPVPGKNGLERSSSIIENTTPTSTSDENESKFTLYINAGTLYVKYSKPTELAKGEIIVYNLLGKEVARKKLDTISINQVTIPSQNTCFLIKISYSGKVYTQKIIVSSAL